MAGPLLTKAAETAGETLGKKAWDLCEKFVKKVALAYNVNIPHLVSHFEDTSNGLTGSMMSPIRWRSVIKGEAYVAFISC